jgi:hypothetical protein
MKVVVYAMAVWLCALPTVAQSDEEPASQYRSEFIELLEDAAGSAKTRFDLSSRKVSAAKCCKVCTKGKPCGDTCIAQDKVCHVRPGCAC